MEIAQIPEMTPADWDVLEKHGNFSRAENWGDPYRLRRPHVYRVQFFREMAARSIAIHCAYDLDGHAKNSKHALGLASDGSIEGMALIEEVEFAATCGFSGIGAYPHTWRRKGFHIDSRHLLGIPTIYWIEDEYEKGKYHYFTDLGKFLKELSKIPTAVEVY